jgi:hypothetical protein
LPLVINVKSTDDAIRAKREDLAHRVVKQFGASLPGSKLLAFFDDQDVQQIRQEFPPPNRGFFAPKAAKFIDLWPHYVIGRIFVADSCSGSLKQVFDHVIYLHGSTCTDEVGLIMTFSHELQHFVQYGFDRKLWAENYLLKRLPTEIIQLERLNWPDIPNEREARIVAKRVAVKICDADIVDAYITRRIRESSDAQDREDWRFSSSVNPATAYNLAEATRSIFCRLSPYRNELERILTQLRRDADFKDLDLAEYLGQATSIGSSN